MTYEGWANYQTWNVSLWINNDQPLYKLAVNYATRSGNPRYEIFISDYMPSEYGDITPDGVSWTDPTLDITALDDMLRELKETA